MGSQLAIEVSTKFGDVGYDAFRVLVHMAVHALDTDSPTQKARRYFGGQEALARAMRPDLPSEEDPSDEAKRQWKNALRDLREAMEILVVCGAVARTVERPKPGARQEWLLTLRRKAAPVSARQKRRKERMAALRRKREQDRLQGEVPPPVQGTVPPPNAGDSSPSTAGDSSPSPGTTEEPREDKQQEPCGSGRASTTGPRGRGKPETKSHLVQIPDQATADRVHKLLSYRNDLGTPWILEAEEEIGPGYPQAVYEVRAMELIATRRTG